jgi:hypothetical protein
MEYLYDFYNRLEIELGDFLMFLVLLNLTLILIASLTLTLTLTVHNFLRVQLFRQQPLLGLGLGLEVILPE